MPVRQLTFPQPRRAGQRDSGVRRSPVRTARWPVTVDALGVRRLAAVGWEADRTQPHRNNRLRYAEFLSWLHQDLGNTDAASYWLDRALQWSYTVGDDDLTTYVMARKAQLAGARLGLRGLRAVGGSGSRGRRAARTGCGGPGRQRSPRRLRLMRPFVETCGDVPSVPVRAVAGGAQEGCRRGRVILAPMISSDRGRAQKCKRLRSPGLVTRDQRGAGARGSCRGLLRLDATFKAEEQGSDMKKSTRDSSRSDRWSDGSGVRITPPMDVAPVPSTAAHA